MQTPLDGVLGCPESHGNPWRHSRHSWANLRSLALRGFPEVSLAAGLAGLAGWLGQFGLLGWLVWLGWLGWLGGLGWLGWTG